MAEHSSQVPTRVFITGGSGFVGRAIIDELLRRGHRVRALVNRSSIDVPGAESVRGDLFDDAVLDRALQGCDAVIHLVGIIREVPEKGQMFERIHHQGAVRVIESAKRAGVERFIHMSALGARADSASDYARTKFAAEQHLLRSGLDYTVYRPSVIHGPRGEFMRMVADWAFGRAMPFVFMPYFGTGLLGQSSRLLQPVFVEDVARAFVDAVEKPETVNQTFPLVGAQPLSWPALYERVATALRGKRRLTFGIPTWYASILTHALPASWLPFNKSQVVMAAEDNTADTTAVAQLLGWQPRGFDETFAGYADALRRDTLEKK